MVDLQDAFVVIVSLCLFAGGLTLALSVVLFWFDQRRESVRAELLPVLFEQLEDPGPESVAWYGSLSVIEQYVVRRTIVRYLRRLQGSDHQQLVTLSSELGLDEQAISLLRSRFSFNTLRGLIWLTLLERPVSKELLQKHCTNRPDTRAAAARLICAVGDENAGGDGTALLLRDGDQPLSVYGIDTLYQLNKSNATPLLSNAEVDASWWDNSLLLQCLTVLAHCQSAERVEHFEWIPPLLSDDSPQIRAGALNAFERHGWRDVFREHVDIERVVADRYPEVRTAGYELLSQWGDRRAMEWLHYAVLNDPDDRSRLAAARTLVATGHDLPTPAESATDTIRTVEWARAELRSRRRVATGWS
ncbi:HEAT repeat domain-containing protein [Natronorubrum halophilum]|uniref:HEAT repeat domain-containing protein n=1 Tax=Natronorubrum halophilum TaxID=1702106 RepID=UPI0010C23E60|nr:HEAT repeat domain-containing protein [Natronorubrum halophilum]